MKLHKIFFFFLLILLPTQLGIHFWPDWASVLGRRVDYLSPTLYLTDILIILTISSYLIFNFHFFLRSRIPLRGTIFNQFSKFKNQIFKKNHVFLLAGILFVVFNIVVSANRPVAIYKWAKVLEFGFFGWYIVKTKPSLASVVFPVSLGVFYSSVLAIAQFVFQRSIGGPLWFFGERTFTIDTPGIARISWYGREVLRSYATFPHPNVLGGFLVTTLPLIIFYQMKKFSMFKIIIITIGLIALFLTFSRSAWIVGMGVCILYYGVWVKSKKSPSLFTIIRNAIPILILVFVLWKIYPLVGESVIVRQQLNSSAIALWKTSPLFGIGLGNFLVQLPNALPSRSIYFLQPVHNIYLLLLSEVGIVGVGLVALWVLWVLKHELRIMNYGKGQNKELFMIHTSLFIILILGLVDHYPLTLQQGQILFVVIVSLSIVSQNRSIHDITGMNW